MLLNLSDHLKTPKNFRLPQRAIVVYNDDPRRLGRVKCVIAGLIEGRLDALPWIAPWHGGSSKSSSDGHVPEVGSILAVEFPFDDIYSGFFTGAWKTYETATGLYNSNYPEVSGKRDEAGNRWTVDRVKGTSEYVHSSGSSVLFESNGNISFKNAGKIRFDSDSGKSSLVFDSATGKLSLQNEELETTGSKLSVKNKELSVAVQSLSETVSGGKTVDVSGTLQESVAGSSARSVGGDLSDAVAGETSSLRGGKVKETLGLGKESTVVLGDLLERLVAGNRKVVVVLGDTTYSLTAGNYKVNVAAGNIELSTLLGTFKCGNTLSSISMDPSGSMTVQATAMMSLKATGPIQLQSGAMIELTAPIIALNKAAGGMVVTTLTSPVVDTISGAPTIGVPTVLAG